MWTKGVLLCGSIAIAACVVTIAVVLTDNRSGSQETQSSDLVRAHYGLSDMISSGATIDEFQPAAESEPDQVSFAGPTGMLPVHVAAQHGRDDIVRYLVEEHAVDPNVTVGHAPLGPHYAGMTPLHFAVAARHAETARVLLSLGADPAVEDDHGRDAPEHARMARDTALEQYLQDAMP